MIHSNNSPTALRNLHFSQSEMESSNIVLMPVMVTEDVNLEEQLGDMKVAMDRILKEKHRDSNEASK